MMLKPAMDLATFEAKAGQVADALRAIGNARRLMLLCKLVEVPPDRGLRHVQLLGGLLDADPPVVREEFEQRVPARVPVHRASLCALRAGCVHNNARNPRRTSNRVRT